MVERGYGAIFRHAGIEDEARVDVLRLGGREEHETYLATAEGSAELPEISFEWYNLESGAVETVSVPAHGVTILPGPEAPAARGDGHRLRIVAMALAAALLVYAVVRWAGPPVREALDRMRARWEASELRAHLAVRPALRRRDLGLAYGALRAWSAFHPGLAASARQGVEAALAGIGAGRFKSGAQADGRAWRRLETAYLAARRQSARRTTAADALPGLNPRWM